MKDSLITPAELARIDRLELSQPNPDISWLCQIARRLARLKPSEAEFPAYVALINQNIPSAFPIRRDEVIAPVEYEVRWVGGPSATLLELKLFCERSDAFLLVRPYVRLVAPKSEGTFEQLARLGKITVLADEVVLAEGSLAEHLVGFDGYGFHRKPFAFATGGRPEKNVFGVGTLNEDKTASPGELGVFLPDETTVTVKLSYPLRDGEEIALSTGLVMARYTTKDCQYWPVPIKVNA